MKITSYVIGYIVSLALTFAAYFLVKAHVGSGGIFISIQLLILLVLIAAFVQFIVQSIFFLHLNEESGPRWNLNIFISTFGILLIIIVGSIWIMAHLNYNMTPAQIQQYIQNEIVDGNT